MAIRAHVSETHMHNIIHHYERLHKWKGQPQRHVPDAAQLDAILMANEATEDEILQIMWAYGHVPSSLQQMEMNEDTLLLMNLLSVPIGTVTEELQRIRTELYLSMHKWALEAHVDHSLFSRAMKEERSFSFDFLEKLCDCSFITELDRARILWSAGYVPTSYFKRRTSRTALSTKRQRRQPIQQPQLPACDSESSY